MTERYGVACDADVGLPPWEFPANVTTGNTIVGNTTFGGSDGWSRCDHCGCIGKADVMHTWHWRDDDGQDWHDVICGVCFTNVSAGVPIYER